MNVADVETLGPIPGTQQGAIIFGEYRYLLWRAWDETLPRLLWVLLNPSRANESDDDPTLRRCMTFSRRQGFGSLELVNLFALRTPFPNLLKRPDMAPVGGENDRYIVAAARRATRIMVAWGAEGTYQGRDRAVLALLRRYTIEPVWCLGTTQSGCPRHPLYLANATEPMPYR